MTHYDRAVKRRKQYIVRPHQLEMLASAPRQEIVDLLARMGTVTMAELGATLGRPADALYYHVRKLVGAGLVIQVPGRGEKGRQEARFRAVSPELVLRYPMVANGETLKVSAIVSSMLRLGIRDFRKALRSPGVQLSGPRRELWALRAAGWLNADEIEGVNKKIQTLRDAVWKPKGTGRLYGITILLTPLDHRARKSRSSTQKKNRRK